MKPFSIVFGLVAASIAILAVAFEATAQEKNQKKMTFQEKSRSMVQVTANAEKPDADGKQIVSAGADICQPVRLRHS